MSAPTMESTWEDLLEQVAAVGRCLDDQEELKEQLKRFDQATKGLVFYNDLLHPKQHLVHYTSWNQALAILDCEEVPVLRRYSFERTNDPQEGRLWRRVWGGITDDAERIDNLLPSYNQTLIRSGRSTGSTFGCCFSAGEQGVEDNLTFWRLYGNDGNGCSFRVSGHPPNTYRVRYLDERGRNEREDDERLDQQICSWMCELLKVGSELVNQFLSSRFNRKHVASWMAEKIRTVIGGYNHLVKSNYFKDENEWRMIDVGPPTDSILYDVDEARVVRRYVPGLSLSELLITGSSITIGPQVPNGGEARAYVERLVKLKDIRPEEPDVPSLVNGSQDRWPEVKLSKLTYRSAR